MLVRAAPAEQFDGVGYDVEHRINRLDCTLCGAGRIENQRLSPCASQGPTQPAKPLWIAESHRFGQTRRFPLNRLTSAFWCEVSRAEPGAAGGDDHAVKPIGQFDEGITHRLDAVGDLAAVNNVVSSLGEVINKGLTRRVFTGASDDTV